MSLKTKSTAETFRENPQLAFVAGGAVLAMGCMVTSLTFLLSEMQDPQAHWHITAAFGLALAALMTEMSLALFGQRHFQSAQTAKMQTDELFAMTDMLQSAEGYEDAAAVLMASSLRLLPDFGVALYVFNNSRDRLDLTGEWNMPDGYNASDSLAPSNCWTLKRGKLHINNPTSGTLCCAHHGSNAAVLEVPMMARGSVYGLLVFAVAGSRKSADLLAEVSRMAQALADSMSLALSNISLREKLRSQSLRDPLTGLYNRRYMEDSLERYVSLGERNGSQTSVLMLDLDNFKKLNDEQGHAKGDAVLRDVAAQLISGLRPTDVVCRYGGEEILVILPGCPLEEALAKAEGLRLRVEALSEVHNVSVSVSIGAASIPETSTSVADLVAMADSALYVAKSSGKNRVAAAELRATRDETHPRLSVAV